MKRSLFCPKFTAQRSLMRRNFRCCSKEKTANGSDCFSLGFVVVAGLCIFGVHSLNVSQCSDELTIASLEDQINGIYTRFQEKQHLPGVAWGVTVGGKLVAQNYIGYRNVEEKSMVTKQTPFRIASMSKSFTALAILKLRDEGLLSLSDPVSKYIPELKIRGEQEQAVLTIRHLLNMTGGLPQDDPWGDRLLAQSTEDFVKLLSEELNLSTSIGHSYEYSNLSYSMLGLIIARVSGKKYSQYVSESIFEPLGMMNSTFDYEAVRNPLAIGYRWEENQWKREPLLKDGAFSAMGGMITTIEDFSKYVQFHIAAANSSFPYEPNYRAVVRASTAREMQSPSAFRRLTSTSWFDNHPSPCIMFYGYGLWWAKDVSLNNLHLIGHAGGLPGYGSEFRIIPKLGVAVMSFANGTYVDMSIPNQEVVALILQHLSDKSQATVSGTAPGEMATRFKFSVDNTNLPVSMPLLHSANYLKKNLLRAQPPLFYAPTSAEEQAETSDNLFLDKPKSLWAKDWEHVYDAIGGINTPSASAHHAHDWGLLVSKDINAMNDLRGTFRIRGKNGKSAEVYFTLTPENKPRIQEIKIKLL